LFLIAFYGLFAAVIGGMAAALDTTAGERERASLEPLLTTPVAPLELATGKWLAVVALNATAVVSTLTGFYPRAALRAAACRRHSVPVRARRARPLRRRPDSIDPLMPAILLYVGSHGRSFKEAQSNLSVLLFAISLVPIMQMFAQRKEPAWLAWIPISGQYALLSRALRGEALPAVELAQSYVAPMLLTLVALIAVARLFLARVGARRKVRYVLIRRGRNAQRSTDVSNSDASHAGTHISA
jgi:sodium transport system permease protein